MATVTKNRKFSIKTVVLEELIKMQKANDRCPVVAIAQPDPLGQVS
jgi:hypothetical protein